MTLTWFLSRRLLSVSAAATRVVAARAAETSREAEVSFADGSTFLFHALWLRDACRDASCVEAQSERKLSASPLVTRLPMSVGIKQIHVDEDGQSLRVEWDCGEMGLLLSDLVPREAHRTPPKAFLQWAAEAHDEHVAQEVGHARAAAAS